MLQSFTKKEHIFWIASGYHLVFASQSIPNVGLNKNHIIFPLSISTFGCPPPKKKNTNSTHSPSPKTTPRSENGNGNFPNFASPVRSWHLQPLDPYLAHHHLTNTPSSWGWSGSPGWTDGTVVPGWSDCLENATLGVFMTNIEHSPKTLASQIGWFSEHIWIQL